MSFEAVSLETIQELAHQYGYWVIFLGILLENLGIPLPGESITIVGGFLAGNNELNYWFVLGCAVLGAFLGGNFGYWIGRYGGWPLMVNAGKIFRIKEEKLQDFKQQFSENAGKTVFIGRFIALLRIFASPLAGIAEMPFLKFMVYNLAGAVSWASVMVTLAFFAGRIVPLEQLITWVAQFAVVALLLVIGWIFVPLWWETRQAKASDNTQLKQPD